MCIMEKHANSCREWRSCRRMVWCTFRRCIVCLSLCEFSVGLGIGSPLENSQNGTAVPRGAFSRREHRVQPTTGQGAAQARRYQWSYAGMAPVLIVGTPSALRIWCRKIVERAERRGIVNCLCVDTQQQYLGLRGLDPLG